MHEASLVSNLIQKILSIARQHDAAHVSMVRIKLGALSHMSPNHFRDHFHVASKGTLIEDADLDIRIDTDTTAPDAQEITLTSIDVDEPPS